MKIVSRIVCGTVRAYKFRKRKKGDSIKMIKVALEAFGYITIGALVWIYSIMMLSVWKASVLKVFQGFGCTDSIDPCICNLWSGMYSHGLCRMMIQPQVLWSQVGTMVMSKKPLLSEFSRTCGDVKKAFINGPDTEAMPIILLAFSAPFLRGKK